MKLPAYAKPIGLSACALLISCATEEYANVPASVVEDCRREAALLAESDALPAQEDPLQGPALESLPEPIEDARRARQDAGESLAAWPEEALLYRCFESRGIQLDTDQAELLDEWQRRSGPAGEPAEPRE